MPAKKTTTSKKQSALSKVQSLYLMQVELWNFLDDKEADSEKTKSAQQVLKEFNTLLKEVDWQYMGGEEVLETLQSIPQEVNKKLKLKGPARKTTAKKPAAKKPATKKVAAVRKKAKKPTAKKAAAKKTTKKKK